MGGAIGALPPPKAPLRRVGGALQCAVGGSLRSSGYPELTCVSFIGMGEVATKEAFDWVTSIPKIVRASAEICRFTDDIYSSEVIGVLPFHR